MPTADKVIADILDREGYTSSQDFIKDMTLWLALARKEQYKAECWSFEVQYGMPTNKFEQLPYAKKIELVSEDDIKDWEFAASSLRWWEEKLEQLHKLVGETERVKLPFEPRFGEILSVVARELRRP